MIRLQDEDFMRVALQMARNAGAAGVGVTFGASSVETLAQCNPVGIAHTVEELAAVLGVQDLL